MMRLRSNRFSSESRCNTLKLLLSTCVCLRRGLADLAHGMNAINVGRAATKVSVDSVRPHGHGNKSGSNVFDRETTITSWKACDHILYPGHANDMQNLNPKL